jgi:glycerol-3-phosphate dehydrogenase
MADIEVNVIPGKGTMVAMNHRVVNTVLNRCKMPDDGDIIVPIHTVAVIGTTDETVDDPEHLRIEPWEVQLMLDYGDKMVPGISRARVLRAWAGARPLYQEAATVDTRDVTRSFTLLDHEARDGVAGFLTMTGGKWTTFRLMAEKAVDRAAEKLGRPRPCTTASTPVPGIEQGHYWLGHRLEEVEDQRLQGELICECELVTRDMLENAARNNLTLTLDDLRRDVRLGMGPCQGGFCTYRATGILHELGPREPETAIHAAKEGDRWEVAYMQSPAGAHQAAKQAGRQDSGAPGPRSSEELMSTSRANLLLRDFLQERWKGVLPILWGRQLKQERLDELIYLSVLNADHLPGAERSSPLTDFYAFDTTPTDDAEAGDA